MRRFERREVLMPGSSSLADTCVVCGRQPPRFIFFALSGSLCNIAQLALDRALTLVLPPDVWWTPTASWTLSYTFTVPLRHLSHAYCVFGQHADPFWLAMSKTFMTYVSTIVASTAVNMLLVWGDVCKPDIALIITACFSVVWSYVALRNVWRPADSIHDNPGRGKYQQLAGRGDPGEFEQLAHLTSDSVELTSDSVELISDSAAPESPPAPLDSSSSREPSPPLARGTVNVL